MQLSVHAQTRKCMEYKEGALRARGSAQDACQARSRVKGRQASSPGLGCQQVSQPLHTTSLSRTDLDYEAIMQHRSLRKSPM